MGAALVAVAHVGQGLRRLAVHVSFQRACRCQFSGWSTWRHEIRISELVHADGFSQAGTGNSATARHVKPRTVYLRAWRVALAVPNRRDLQRTANNRQA